MIYSFDIETEMIPKGVPGGLTPYLVEFKCGAVKGQDGYQAFTKDPYEFADLITSIVEQDHQIVGHNICQFDLPILDRYTNDDAIMNAYKTRPTSLIDTLILAKSYFPDNFRPVSRSMDALLKRYGLPAKHDITDWENVTDEELKIRVLSDCDLQLQLLEAMSPQMKQNPLVYKSLQMFMVSTAVQATVGIPIDHVVRKEQYAKAVSQVADNKQKTIDFLGPLKPKESFATKYIVRCLKEKGLPPLPTTDKGNASLGKNVRGQVLENTPELKAYIDYVTLRATSAMLSDDPTKATFKNVSTVKVGHGPRAFPKFNCLSQVSHRSAYSNPAVQNLSKDLRSFVALPDDSPYELLGCDLTGQENFIAAWAIKLFLGDSNMLNELKSGCPKTKTKNAFEAAGLMDRVAEEDRLSIAKQINYAVAYGQRPRATCTRSLGLPEHYVGEVERVQNEAFPGLMKLEEYLQRKVRNNYMPTLYGSRVFCFKPTSHINSFIQSTASYMAMHYFGVLYQELLKIMPEANAFVRVHDEENYIIKKGYADSDIQSAFDSTYKLLEEDLGFLITVFDWKRGMNWHEIH